MNEYYSRVLDLVYEYLYNRRVFMEHDLAQLRENILYRPATSDDCFKYIIAYERLRLFKEVSHDLLYLFGVRHIRPP